MIDPTTRNELLERADEARRVAEQMQDAEAREELRQLSAMLHRLAHTWVIDVPCEWIH